ncbi:unnamed protein product [Miscanthus lutarioriparius]|uniref:Helitron helicase-like domain-containing protein n=1 Tax=Miscanthus lutarioriparius TaxID=422564 RepID=A0A811RBC8_9POAL|nr:unnamed protein product [Miscanthus lutarioriparius]
MSRRKLGPKIVSINYQRSRLARLKDEADASKLEEARAKNRENQCSHLARLKAKADASKLEEARAKNPIHDDKGSSCKRKRDMTSEVGNISIFDSGLWEPEDALHGIEDFKYEYCIEPITRMNGHGPYNFVYVGLPKTHHVLKKAQNYFYCRAKRFEEVLDELRRLFTSQTDMDTKYFGRNIRYFNTHFSITNMGVSIDRSLATAKGIGIYTFKAHGQIYHKLDQLVPGVRGPHHMQLYFYDTYETMHHRIKRSPHLDAGVIRSILNIMQDNPYVQILKSLGTLTNLDCYTIELNTSISVDQRRYNAPAMEQVAAIWFDRNDPQQRFE